jgi:hypothetical protein
MAGLGSAIVVAISLTVVDLYLAGHGLRPLSTPWLDWAAGGVHLSLADVVFLGAAALAAAIAWRHL